MIKIEFTAAWDVSWAHEMLRNAAWLNTMREHGIPVVGRLAFSGVERGTLRFDHDFGASTFTFVFAESGEPIRDAVFKLTQDRDGVRVFRAGQHLPVTTAEDDLW